MITLPLLTEKDLEIFQGKKVVIWGSDDFAKRLSIILEGYSINVVAYCTYSLRVELTDKGDKPIIRPDKLKKLHDVSKDYIIQIGSLASLSNPKLTGELDALGVPYSKFELSQMFVSFEPQVICEALKDPDKYTKELSWWDVECTRTKDAGMMRLMNKKVNSPIIICMPPKTADHTLNHTFNYLNTLKDNSGNGLYKTFNTMNGKVFKNKKGYCYRGINRLIQPLDKASLPIPYANTFHKARLINRAECEKAFGTLKIIVAVREPISQNISRLFQDISGQVGNAGHLPNWILGDLENKEGIVWQERVSYYEDLFVNHSDDVQMMWGAWLERFVYPTQDIPMRSFEPKTVQQFILEFKEHILDILAYPFDQEKGYTIIKDGNTEVFVYQLEKLNHIVPELSQWIGVPFDSLVKANVGEDKWNGDAYKQALKEIQITQEYFDRCFNEPYVKHFYSEADIEKFKARWRGHIK